jgi:hypothetical protein
MLILIRIILQRLFLLLISFLTFLGISPEVSIPTESEAREAQEQRQETIQKLLTPDGVNILPEINIIPLPENNTIPISEPQKTNPPITQTFPTANPITETPPSPNTINIVEEAKKIIQEPAPNTQNSIQESVVNIICLHRSGNIIESHTGSGVIINSKGVVVTNAHVAQYFLLESSTNPNFVQCNLYKENLSLFGYKAKILYISPEWIRQNYTLIRDKNPKGTGEGDYAFLYITDSTNSSIQKPNNLYSANFSINHNYRPGENIFIAGYPGSPRNSLELNRAVTLRTDNSIITDLFTLVNNTIDIISTGVTDVAQRGSSGGGIFSGTNLIGLIVTVSPDMSGGNRINALTTEYINRHLENNAGFNVSELMKGDFISGDLISKVDDFYETEVPELRNLLMRVY